MFFQNVKGIFNKITIAELLLSIIYFVLGIIFFASTNLSNKLVAVIVGIILIINGLVNIFSYIKREDIALFNLNLIFGVVLIAIGILTFTMSNVLNILLGVFLLLVGIQKINYGLVLRRFNESSWLITLVTGLLFIIISVVSMFTNSDFLIKVSGILLIGYAAMNFASILLLRLRSKNFLE